MWGPHRLRAGEPGVLKVMMHCPVKGTMGVPQRLTLTSLFNPCITCFSATVPQNRIPYVC